MKKKQTHTLTIRLTQEAKENLSRVAEKTGVPAGIIARIAIEKELKNATK